MQRTELAAHQIDYRMPHLFQHAAHDAVASGVQGDLHDRVAAGSLIDDAGLVGLDRAVLQVDAGEQSLHGGRGDPTLDTGDVGLEHAEGGVGEHVGEFAVVGENQQARGLGVEAAHVEQALLKLRHEAVEVGAAAVILQRRHDADRLVEHEVAAGGVELDGHAVDRHEVGFLHATAELHDDLAVHLHTPGRNQILRDPAGGNPRGRHQFLQANAVVSRVIVHHQSLPIRRRAAAKCAAAHRSS